MRMTIGEDTGSRLTCACGRMTRKVTLQRPRVRALFFMRYQDMAVQIRDPFRAPRLSDLLERIGSIPTERLLLDPLPGTATEADLLRPGNGNRKLCELIDGVLVEKPKGLYESVLASVLIQLLGSYLQTHPLGFVSGPDGTVRLKPALVREPDVAFVSWDRLPGGLRAAEAIPSVAPDLAVEVLSKGNTAAEMRRKVSEYFAAGTERVWILDPKKRSVRVYTGPGTSSVLTDDDVLTAEDILPGFRFSVREWLDRAEGPDHRPVAAP